MKEWIYDIRKTGGNKLKELIRSEDHSLQNSTKIISQLNKCCKILMNKMKKQNDPYIQDLKDFYDIINVKEVILSEKPYLIVSDWEFKSIDEFVNDRLEQFYDICFKCRCWIG